MIPYNVCLLLSKQKKNWKINPVKLNFYDRLNFNFLQHLDNHSISHEAIFLVFCNSKTNNRSNIS